MTAARQLPLDLDFRPGLSGDDFLVAPANAQAVAWIDRWPDWPGPLLALIGPSGSGKTHLARVFAARSGAAFADLTAITGVAPPTLLGEAPALVIEDVAAGLRPERERALLHVCNWIAETRRSLLLTADQPPARWAVSLPDLRSRLNAAAVTTIESPDDVLLTGVLAKLFADRQLRVDSEVLSAILARIERTFEGARRAVATLDSAALADRRAVSVALVRRVLNADG